MKIHLVIIDPQNDFCQPMGFSPAPGVLPSPQLPVAGADEDMKRVAKMIAGNAKKIDDIQVTLDSHQIVHIAHPICWVDADGNNPDPFTIVSLADVEGNTPKWTARNPARRKCA